MTVFKTAAISILLLLSITAFVALGDDKNTECAPLVNLGSPTADFSVAVDMDENTCEYSMFFFFDHDETLPVPETPQINCVPPNVGGADAIASDGLPYLASRWLYKELDEAEKAITGIDHVSIDWNPCGHPPFDVFTVPHYDVHFYKVTPEYRACMTCAQPPQPGPPTCLPLDAQTTPSGLDYFDIDTVDVDGLQPRNMPEGFRVDPEAYVAFMAGHAWDPAQQPQTAADWDYPIWVMGPYAGTVIHFEPMIPITFFSGSEEKYHEESLEYVDQTMEELPSSYSVTYIPETPTLLIYFEGMAKQEICTTKSSKSGKSAKKGKKSKKSKD